MKVFNLSVLLLFLFFNSPAIAQQNTGSVTDKVKEFLKSDSQKKKEAETKNKNYEKARLVQQGKDQSSMRGCQFNLAQIKVNAFIKKNKFLIIETYNPSFSYGAVDFDRLESHCGVDYKYLVKEIMYNSITNSYYYSDVLYQLNISFVKYKSGYEITSATLYNRNTNRKRSLI